MVYLKLKDQASTNLRL